MDFLHSRGHEALRRGRRSIAGAEYFLTICTQNRAAGLHASALGMMLLTGADQLTSTRHWDLRTGVIMPDHLHLLVTLGEHSQLSNVVRLFKGRLVGALRAAGMKWQHGFFDHRMRPDEDRLPVFLYIFLHAYRAELLHADEK